MSDKSKDQFTEYVDRAFADLPSEVKLNLNQAHKEIGAVLLQAYEAGKNGEQLDAMPKVTKITSVVMHLTISAAEGTKDEKAVTKALSKVFF